MSRTKIRFLGELERSLRAAAIAAALDADAVTQTEDADLVVVVVGESPIRVWREYRGWSQRVLAARAGVNFAYLSQIETGVRKGPSRTLKKIAEAVDLELADLT